MGDQERGVNRASRPATFDQSVTKALGTQVMKSYSIQQRDSDTFVIREDGKESNYITVTLFGLLKYVAKLSREGHQLVLEDKTLHDKVIIHRLPS